MKKLMKLVMLLLITTTSFGQSSLGYYGKNILTNGGVVKRGGLYSRYYYGFTTYDIKNGIKTDSTNYILAYDENQEFFSYRKLTKENGYKLTKDLLLYRWNGSDWIVASNVASTDYQKGSEIARNQLSADNFDYIIKKGLSDGYVKIQKDGSVVMKIVKNLVITNYNNETSRDFHYITVIFTPNGDGTYTATQQK